MSAGERPGGCRLCRPEGSNPVRSTSLWRCHQDSGQVGAWTVLAATKRRRSILQRCSKLALRRTKIFAIEAGLSVDRFGCLNQALGLVRRQDIKVLSPN